MIQKTITITTLYGLTLRSDEITPQTSYILSNMKYITQIIDNMSNDKMSNVEIIKAIKEMFNISLMFANAIVKDHKG